MVGHGVKHVVRHLHEVEDGFRRVERVLDVTSVLTFGWTCNLTRIQNVGGHVVGTRGGPRYRKDTYS